MFITSLHRLLSSRLHLSNNVQVGSITTAVVSFVMRYRHVASKASYKWPRAAWYGLSINRNTNLNSRSSENFYIVVGLSCPWLYVWFHDLHGSVAWWGHYSILHRTLLSFALRKSMLPDFVSEALSLYNSPKIPLTLNCEILRRNLVWLV